MIKKRVFVLIIIFFTFQSLHSMKHILACLCPCKQNRPDDDNLNNEISRLLNTDKPNKYGPHLAELLDRDNLKNGYRYMGKGMYERSGQWIYSHARYNCEPVGNL